MEITKICEIGPYKIEIKIASKTGEAHSFLTDSKEIMGDLLFPLSNRLRDKMVSYDTRKNNRELPFVRTS